jgi:hypothetical protein
VLRRHFSGRFNFHVGEIVLDLCSAHAVSDYVQERQRRDR